MIQAIIVRGDQVASQVVGKGPMGIPGPETAESIAIAQAARDDAAASAGTATQQATIATDEADLAAQAAASAAGYRDEAQTARDAALGAKGLFPSTAAAVGNGVSGYTSLVGGSGGTNGTFPLVTSGGTQVVPVTGTFTVSGGAVTAINVTSRGYYSTNPTGFNFSASAGLTGASAVPVLTPNTANGEYFQVPSAVSSRYLELYKNNAGVAVLDDSAPNLASMNALLELDRTGAIDTLIDKQIVGRPAGTPVTGTAVSDATYLLNDKATHASYIIGITGFAMNSGGPLQIKVFNPATGVKLSETTVTIPAGQFYLRTRNGDFAPILVPLGYKVAVRAFSGTGKFAFKSATAADGSGWIQLGVGDINSFTPPGGTVVTTTQLQIGFEFGYPAFEDDYPARITELEGLAKPFNAGETSLSAIAGCITAFDCREGRDIAAGKLRAWQSQDRRLTALQETLANRPTYNAASRLVDLSSTAAILVAYPKATLRDICPMPDSTISPFEMPPGGAVWCGLGQRSDRILVVTNDGRRKPNANDWTAANNGGVAAIPTLALMRDGVPPQLLERGGVTFEWNLRDVTDTSGNPVTTLFANSAQGVAPYYDSGESKWHYKVGDYGAGIVRDFRDNNDGTITYVPARDITPHHGSGMGQANGVAISPAGEVYIGNADVDSLGNTLVFSTISVHNLTTGAFVRDFIAPVNIDQLTFARGFLFGTFGANGAFADLYAFSTTGEIVDVKHSLPGAQAAEGILVSEDANRIRVLHDGNYHNQGDIDASVLCTIDVDLPVAGVDYTPGRVLLSYVGRLTTSAAKPILGHEDSSAGRCGWGFRALNATTGQLACSQRGVSYSVTFPVPETTMHIVVADVNTATGAVRVWVNGVLVTVTGNLAGYTYGFTGYALVFGGEVNEDGSTSGAGLKELRTAYVGSVDDIAGSDASVQTRALALSAVPNANFAMGLL
jgi:hypothetical protein